jgi:hypothetical protein
MASKQEGEGPPTLERINLDDQSQVKRALQSGAVEVGFFSLRQSNVSNCSATIECLLGPLSDATDLVRLAWAECLF